MEERSGRPGKSIKAPRSISPFERLQYVLFVRLPIHCRINSKPSGEEHQSDPMNSGPILLVEDNADDVELALMAFHRNNIPNEIIIAWDGPDALDFLNCQGKYRDRTLTQYPCLILL